MKIKIYEKLQRRHSEAPFNNALMAVKHQQPDNRLYQALVRAVNQTWLIENFQFKSGMQVVLYFFLLFSKYSYFISLGI
jgi:hypothetical protein